MASCLQGRKRGPAASKRVTRRKGERRSEGDEDADGSAGEALLRGAGGFRAGGGRGHRPRSAGGGRHGDGRGGDRGSGDPGTRCQEGKDPTPRHRGTRGRTATRRRAGCRAGTAVRPRRTVTSTYLPDILEKLSERCRVRTSRRRSEAPEAAKRVRKL